MSQPMNQPSPPGDESPTVATAPAGPPPPPTRRTTELWLLAFSAALLSIANILVDANQEAALTSQILYNGAAFLALFAAAHFAVRKWAPYADPLILPFAALLNGLGLVMIHRIDLAMASRLEINPEDAQAAFYGGPLVGRQIMWMVIGVAFFILTLWRIKDHRPLAKYGYTCGLVGLVALALPGIIPFSSIAPTVNGAKIWLRFPGGFSIQPGEFAKILLMIFFASFLVSKRELFTAAGRTFLRMNWPRARDMAPLFVAWGASVGVLVFERDLGTSLLFFGMVLVMLYIATERAAWVVLGLTLFVGGCLVAYQLFGHVRQRIANWMDPFATYDEAGGGYQIVQSLFSLGSGGIFGSGLGSGRPDIVPEPHTDFITVGMGEEMGFVGLSAVLILYLLLVMRGLRSALAVRDSFGKLLAGGLAFTLGLQVFIVVGGVTKLIPSTGITAPFLSYGGSSLLANYILIALLLRISDAARRPAAPPKPKPKQAPIAEAHTEMVARPT
ncbi:FtsW/RodA/SpoVE family cell cycle protein [Actinoalloteichus sp. AHMU CJ021]|uniref:Cell division protein FtsW, lipid II flippase n=2 Tax=Actinoalloteichus cyanogriseus TaxID=2893586 RepID=A0ABT1JKT1_ACTCY|nr:FtsW/RodA/SpoVE family cell cycle protein [Actinoalloteichus caeruleus]AUS78773.1 FtsW/RodA/SpoVE family cell cycle protein [Actinoalloteichus sp. AHMU CJ021]MCP2332942.1 cell division protein FtsW, lipid II flippase [Actinoalloteichus caeruleus DSM 43889]